VEQLALTCGTCKFANSVRSHHSDWKTLTAARAMCMGLLFARYFLKFNLVSPAQQMS